MLARPVAPALALVVAALVAGAPTEAQFDCQGVAEVATSTLSGVTVATGLSGRPLLVTAPPGDRDRIFIVEQNGFIRILRRGAAPTAHTLFLNVQSRITFAGDEQGLLGLAFDPEFNDPVDPQKYFYINYTRSGTGQTVISRWRVSATDPDVADVASEEILMIVSQPQSNHNGGNLEFGPDGYLYIGLGDGGSGNDPWGPCGNGQNRTQLLGKILRIIPRGTGGLPSDCGGSVNYRVPADNPFVDGAGGLCDEIWAFGLRNPWRFAFDADNGDLYIADVGQNCWEEIDWTAGGGPGGENYGWRVREGAHCFNPSNPFTCNLTSAPTCLGSPSCSDPSLVDPVYEYSSAGSSPCSVTGGYVYRGCRLPAIRGKYFFGDYCAGSIQSLEMVGGVATNLANWTSQVDPGGTLLFNLTNFGRDGEGELYVTDRTPGAVIRINPPFTAIEASGPGGSPFALASGGDWSWEDVAYTTWSPVSYYRIYRGTPGATFSCVHSSALPAWAGGDPQTPAAGELFAYIVTAVSPGGQETSSGTPPRTLVNPCGPPPP